VSVSVGRALMLPWGSIVRVAKRDLSLADAQERELERLKSENGEFVGCGAVALIHGVTFSGVGAVTRGDGFPNLAFVIQRGRIWHLSDVEAHHGGEPFPDRAPGGLQHQVMTTSDISRLCGLRPDAVRDAIYRGRPTVPKPAGRVMGTHYWFRVAVEAWADSTGSQAASAKLLSPPRPALCGRV
jgi:hypothetical protein